MPRGVNQADQGAIQGRNANSATSARIIAPEVVADRLVYHLNAGNFQSYPAANSQWYDLSQQKNPNATITGASFSRTGNGSLAFNGSSNYAVCSTLYLSNSTLSIECWLYPTANNPANYIGEIVGRLHAYNEPSFRLVYGSYGATPTNKPGFEFYNGTWQGVQDSTALSLNKWAHLIGTYDSGANSGTLRLYVNGAQVASSTNTGSIRAYTNHKLNIASTDIVNNAPLVWYTPANIAQVRVYNKTLLASEVEQNFNATRAQFGV